MNNLFFALHQYYLFRLLTEGYPPIIDHFWRDVDSTLWRDSDGDEWTTE